MIKNETYAYAIKPSNNYASAVQSIHLYFPIEIRELFDRSFVSKLRPRANEWAKILIEYADPRRKKLIKCNNYPNEHAHFGLGCGFCANLLAQAKPKVSSTKTIHGLVSKEYVFKKIEIKKIDFFSKRLIFSLCLFLVFCNQFMVILFEEKNTSVSSVNSNDLKIKQNQITKEKNINSNKSEGTKFKNNISLLNLDKYNIIKLEGIIISKNRINVRNGPGIQWDKLNVIEKQKRSLKVKK